MAMSILTEQQLHQAAPAIFAEAPDEAVSERYGFVPTIAVVKALQDEGWYPVRAQQTARRDPDKRHLARHMIRFRQAPDRQLAIGDAIAELVLTNSHDRSAAYQLDLGVFRLVCLNGLVAHSGGLGGLGGLGDLGNLRVKHGNRIVADLLAGSVQLANQVPQVSDWVESLRSTLISAEEAFGFAQAALQLRYGADWASLSPVTPQQLLQARRREDEEMSLWKTFNRVQENLLKGGLMGLSQTGRRTRTKAIASVSEDLRLNRGLWQLAEAFSKQAVEVLGGQTIASQTLGGQYDSLSV